MKILVFSDSHSSLTFMRSCISLLKPDHGIHLGDYYNDCVQLRSENRWLPLDQVRGNCDLSGYPGKEGEDRVIELDGIRIFITHGHRYHVKQSLYPLMKEARERNVDIVLFGHTHTPYCVREEDGLWVINPGSAGIGRSTAAILDIQAGKITACRIIGQAALESME